MDRKTLALATLVLAGLAACSAPETRADAAPEDTPVPSPASAAPARTLVLIKTGPKSGALSQEENARAFAGHFANMERMAAEGQLLVAGPYGQRRHDADLRGIFVLASGRRDEARTWAETDPTTQAGVFVLEYHDLATDAPLAAALARDSAWRAEQLAAGRTPQPGEGARPYVLLTAEHGDLAERELGPLRTHDGGVLMLGRLDGTRALALLDAEDLAAAEERFAPQLANLGAHVLDEWFASAELARMIE